MLISLFSATEIKLTIPPHLKVKAEDIPSGPVIGSKKRKARKHSITHLMPVTAENNSKCVDSSKIKKTYNCSWCYGQNKDQAI